MKVESNENALFEHSAILLTCIKRYSVLKTNFWSSFEWPLKMGIASGSDHLWFTKSLTLSYDVHNNVAYIMTKS